MKAQDSIRLVATCVAAAGLVFGQPIAQAGWSDVPPEFRGEISSVVAVVGAVWDDDERLVQFHQRLAERFKDTPEIERFRGEEQWVSTYSSRSVRFPAAFNARSSKSLNLRVGDIVRVRIDDYRKVDSYYRIKSVEEVLCRAADPGFDACSERHPLAWTLKSGQEVRR